MSLELIITNLTKIPFNSQVLQGCGIGKIYIKITLSFFPTIIMLYNNL